MCSKVGLGFEAEVAQSNKAKSNKKGPQGSTRVRATNPTVIAHLVKKVDNLESVLVYKMLKLNELNEPIEEIEVSSCSREIREVEVKWESETKSEEKDIPPPLPFDP